MLYFILKMIAITDATILRLPKTKLAKIQNFDKGLLTKFKLG